MTTAHFPAALYCRLAASRLGEAQGKYARSAGLPYPDDIIELAKMASLVWDAAMDILSALQTLDGEEPSGRSSDLRQYARHRLPPVVYEDWRWLARLHNFQHKPVTTEAGFRRDLHFSGDLLQSLNALLPPTLQFPDDHFRWMQIASPELTTPTDA